MVGKSGFYVYSFDHDEKKITLSEVEKVWKTGEKEVYRLRYGWWSGQRENKWVEDEILATPEHLIMLRGGSYKPLKALKKGESLKAFDSIKNSIEEHRSITVGDKFNSVGRIPTFFKREEIRERYVDNHKVISVEPTGIVVPVYDMTVRKTNNFVANGIIVHNSGATPGEAVSWGKVDPDKLPDAVVAYVDSTVALPIITAYSLARHEPREPKRLFERREEFMDLLKDEYEKSTRR